MDNVKNSKNIYRKTSAEIVSEARNLLATGNVLYNQCTERAFVMYFVYIFTGGTRLVSTRRPITPREPRRLYGGRNAPAGKFLLVVFNDKINDFVLQGRPPSSFSLRYLQFETRALPALEPIVQNNLKNVDVPQFKRSDSENSLSVFDKDIINNNKAKLPALLSVGKFTGSLDNRKFFIPSITAHTYHIFLNQLSAIDSIHINT